ncbi:hypothetical protein ACFQGX_24285 [Nonomuraea dietziae]
MRPLVSPLSLASASRSWIPDHLDSSEVRSAPMWAARSLRAPV